jgi:putative transposase
VTCYLEMLWTYSVRHACGLVGISWSSAGYRGSGRDDRPVTDRFRELAAERRRFGHRRLHVLLCLEGWMANHKRVYRIYRSEGLCVRRRGRKRVARSVVRCLS